MNLPFNKEQFLEIFRDYNTTVFPAQIIFYVLAVLTVFLSLKKSKNSDSIISIVLAFFWLWMGVVYHIIMFSTINNLAYIFGVLFILQGFILLYSGIYKSNSSFKWQSGIIGYTSVLMILYALLIYPVLGYLFGHVYPKSPTFGLPCPTTIFTLAMLLMQDIKYSVMIFLIPLLWSVIGFFAAVKLGIFEDIGLLVSGVISIVLLFYRVKHHKKEILI